MTRPLAPPRRRKADPHEREHRHRGPRRHHQERRSGPRALTDQELSRLLGGQRFGVLASVRSSGHPHLSTVLYDWDAEERVLRVSSTADRLKVRQLRRDPHASLHVNGPDVWSFAVAEGEAEIVDPADGGPPASSRCPTAVW
nr:TIGR03618 family F420-dependent PPOX class oxidoreductase [Streptomyces sp. CL12-4]